MFWGATGPLMEWLLQQTAMTAEFMLAVRLMIAGILILGIAAMQKKSIFSIWKNRNYSVQLLIFSVIGMVGLQFTFVKSIEVSNAIIATLLQFLAPNLHRYLYIGRWEGSSTTQSTDRYFRYARRVVSIADKWLCFRVACEQ